MNYESYKRRHFDKLFAQKQKVAEQFPDSVSKVEMQTQAFNIKIFVAEVLDGVMLDFGTYSGDFSSIGFAYPKNHLSFGYIRSGSYLGRLTKKDFYLPKGSSYVCSPDYETMSCGQITCECVQVLLDITRAKNEVNKILRRVQLERLYERSIANPIILPNDTYVKFLLSRVHIGQSTDMLRLIVLEFLFYLYSYRVKNPLCENSYLTQLIAYIQEYCMQDITLKDLSNMFRVSVSKITKDFKDNFNIPVYQFIKKCRMQKATTLLTESKNSVSDVAYMLGYINVSAFCKNFKQYSGYLPKDYQKLCRG